MICVGDQLVVVPGVEAAVPTNFTDPADPKFVPWMVRVPAAAATVPAESEVMHGLGAAGQLTVKLAGGLFAPPAETTTFVSPTETSGTVTVIDVSAHGGAATLAFAVPNATVPAALPKFFPVMVTVVP